MARLDEDSVGQTRTRPSTGSEGEKIRMPRLDLVKPAEEMGNLIGALFLGGLS